MTNIFMFLCFGECSNYRVVHKIGLLLLLLLLLLFVWPPVGGWLSVPTPSDAWPKGSPLFWRVPKSHYVGVPSLTKDRGGPP